MGQNWLASPWNNTIWTYLDHQQGRPNNIYTHYGYPVKGPLTAPNENSHNSPPSSPLDIFRPWHRSIARVWWFDADSSWDFLQFGTKDVPRLLMPYNGSMAPWPWIFFNMPMIGMVKKNTGINLFGIPPYGYIYIYLYIIDMFIQCMHINSLLWVNWIVLLFLSGHVEGEIPPLQTNHNQLAYYNAKWVYARLLLLMEEILHHLGCIKTCT